jgi:glucose/arabinose dehydrogenase
MKKIILILLLLQVSIIFSQQYMLESVITGLNTPVAFTFLPNNNVILTEKAGLSKIYTLNNVFVSNFWNLTDSTQSGGERGLLGVCLDPNFAVNRYVYFYYIHSTGNRYRVVRLTENNNLGTNPFIVFQDSTASGSIHVAGNIRFGRDNKLYISIGDNGTSSNSQSLTTFKGKMLRLNSDGTIPTDNPFYDDGNPKTGNDDRIWAMGLRNSFDFCFSPLNDSIYATENSPGNPDEINFIRKGKNYGWPVCTGFCFPYNPLYKNPMTGLPGNDFSNYAPTGIMIYTGTQMPELTNKLLVIGSGGGQVFRGLVKCDLGNPPFNDTIISKTILLDITGTTLMQGTDGYIYVMRISQGLIARLKYDLTAINNNNSTVKFSLSQNYPNPFNPVTSIKYEIPTGSFVTLKIYNVLGVEVTSLVNETKQQGSYEAVWDAAKHPSGVYFYEMTAGDFKERRKMVLVK